MKCVESVDIASDIQEIATLIRCSFLGIAHRFYLTPENCPGFTAFISDDALLRQFDRPEAVCLGIRDMGKWVGFVAVAPYRDGYEITRLAVHPDHRHKGYGRLLMDAACAAARDMGLADIGLGIINENQLLKEWYMGQGFVAGEPFRINNIPYSVCGLTKKLT